MKSTTLRSGVRSMCCGCSIGIANVLMKDCVHHASSSATTPDSAAIRNPSVTTSRISRDGLAPSAVRMPMSRSRSTARASSRLATLKQASSSTRPMMPMPIAPAVATPRRSPLTWRRTARSRRGGPVRVGPVARHLGHGGVEVRLHLRGADAGVRRRHHEQPPRVASLQAGRSRERRHVFERQPDVRRIDAGRSGERLGHHAGDADVDVVEAQRQAGDRA